jgi:hypothetical protein|tara:strand:+ start:187 stop:378 length:192 start_codon:yes stop_codon:yes gene_type:complete
MYYLELFKTSQKESLALEKKNAIKHEKELQASKLATLRSVANVMTLSSILRNGGTIENEEDAD